MPHSYRPDRYYVQERVHKPIHGWRTRMVPAWAWWMLYLITPWKWRREGLRGNVLTER